MKTSLFILFCLFSQSLLAGSSQLIPEDKAKLFRNLGESVYVECKKTGPFSTNCQVDCGNGMRFRQPSGYCYYLSQGTFLLNVSTRYRNKDLFHTATVTVTEKTTSSILTSNTDNSQRPTNISQSKHITPGYQTSSVTSSSPDVSNNLPTNTAINSNTLSSNAPPFNNQINTDDQTLHADNVSTLTQDQFAQNLQNKAQELDNIVIQETGIQNNFNQAEIQNNNIFETNTLPSGGDFSVNNSGISNQIQNANVNQVVLH